MHSKRAAARYFRGPPNLCFRGSLELTFPKISLNWTQLLQDLLVLLMMALLTLFMLLYRKSSSLLSIIILLSAFFFRAIFFFVLVSVILFYFILAIRMNRQCLPSWRRYFIQILTQTGVYASICWTQKARNIQMGGHLVQSFSQQFLEFVLFFLCRTQVWIA